MPKQEQGVTNDRFQVIPRNLIFITDGDRVLLIKGGENKRLWANKYNGIGGHVERGEDVLTSAKRELKEETGLEVGSLWLCGSIMIDAGESTGIHLFIFRGTYQGGELKASEEGSLEWIETANLYSYPLVEDLRTILPEVLKLENGHMIYARYDYDENDALRIRYQVV